MPVNFFFLLDKFDYLAGLNSKQVQCSFALFVYSPSNFCIAAQGFFSHNFRTLTPAGSMCAWHTFCATHLIFKFERAVCAPSTCPDLTPENYVLETLFSFSLSSLLLVLRCGVVGAHCAPAAQQKILCGPPFPDLVEGDF